MKRYIAILSITIFLIAGLISADQQTWIVGNIRYTKVPGGVNISPVNAQSQTSPENRNNSRRIQRCIQSCNNLQLQNSQQPTQQSLNISSLAPISDINVAYGTVLAPVNFPTTVMATMSDNSTQDLSVIWDGGTPIYDSNTAGSYIFSGTLILPDNTTNTNNLAVNINVTVAAQPTLSQISNLSLSQTTSPSDVNAMVQDIGASLLNVTGNFFNFIFLPFKVIGKNIHIE